MCKYVWIVEQKYKGKWEDYSMPFMAYELAVKWWGWTENDGFTKRIVKVPLNRGKQTVSRRKK